jgi:lipopolysaccharide transport system permease protein
VTKIYFPREVLPISAVLASLVDLGIAAVVFAGMLLFYRWSVHMTMLLVPLVLGVQILLTLGVVFFAAAVNVFYRDVRFVVPLALQLWLYATPIIYPLSAVPEWLRPYYMLNPMAVLIDSYRRLLLLGQLPDWLHLVEGSAIALVVFCGGYLYFKRNEKHFADLI